MAEYTYAECLARSHRVNWRIDEVLGERRFDPARSWLPLSLSGAATVTCLSDDELRMLTQVEMASYAHLFGYVEEFIAPKVTALAGEHQLDDREAFDALTSFAAEEVKHMVLFREVRKLVDRTLGFETALVGGRLETARFVLGRSTAAVMLFTAAIEWLTLRHYTDAWRAEESLDPLTRSIFRAHWLEESQHAKLDHLETLRAFAPLDDAARDAALDEVIGLVCAVDGLLQEQAALDVVNLETCLGRDLSADQRAEVLREVLRAKRWTFLDTGLTHERFVELLVEVTSPAQRERVGAALQPLLGNEPRVAVAA